MHETQDPFWAGLVIAIALTVFYFTVEFIVRTSKEGFKALWTRIKVSFGAFWKRHIDGGQPYKKGRNYFDESPSPDACFCCNNRDLSVCEGCPKDDALL